MTVNSNPGEIGFGLDLLQAIQHIYDKVNVHSILSSMIKGSLDEKLPSYEVLKMRENR